jgi:hypothetical protein
MSKVMYDLSPRANVRERKLELNNVRGTVENLCEVYIAHENLMVRCYQGTRILAVPSVTKMAGCVYRWSARIPVDMAFKPWFEDVLRYE